MMRRSSLRRILVLALSVSLMPPFQLAHAQATVAGFTPGQFKVSETGAASYAIPIQVPPGTAGMEPKLSLVYNSQGGNGLLGVGWSLGGLSAVTRCGRTIAQDGVNAGIDYGSNDRYCLDGQRLLAISGTYGADGTEYRTERESFTKIISYGAAGNGPAYFKAWTKSGQILEYGNTIDSRIEAQGKTTVRVYALNRIQDTKGNYLTVSYTEDNANGDFSPARIDYTGNAGAGLATSQSVQFFYETRTDNNAQYIGGSLIKTMQRMTSVKAYLGATLVQDYRLAYTYIGSTTASALNSVTQCDTSGNCYPATGFTWQAAQGGQGFGSSIYWGGEGAGGTDQTLVVADFNGDGRADLLTSFLTNLLVQYSTGAGFGVAAILAGYDGKVTAGDVNGDGRADIITANGAVLLSTGSGFAAPVYWGGESSDTDQTLVAADFNGDGRADLLTSFLSNNLLVQYSTGAGFGVAIMVGNYGKATAGDVNGDGSADWISADGSVSLASYPTPNLITNITNGIGSAVNITHQKISDATVYTAETGAAYPVRDLLAAVPLYVVSSHTTSDGIGGNYQMSYAYTGAKIDVSGRGFLGFRVTQATDPQGLKSLSTFRQDWPYVGLPSQAKKQQPSGAILNQVDNTFGCLNPASGAACTVAIGNTYFPYVSQSVEASNDLNGAAMPTVTTTNQFDIYGNATQIVVSTGDGYSKTTTNAYLNDIVNWFLGRLTRSTVASTTP